MSDNYSGLTVGDFCKWGANALIALVVLIAVGFVLNLAGFAQFAFFAPKVTAVQNKVFHESQQYNDGMVRDLENLRLSYLQATPEQKSALRGTIIHRFSLYPRDRMPPELLSFYESIESDLSSPTN